MQGLSKDSNSLSIAFFIYNFFSVLQGEIKLILTKLMNDADFDVRYFAEEAKNALGLH